MANLGKLSLGRGIQETGSAKRHESILPSHGGSPEFLRRRAALGQVVTLAEPVLVLAVCTTVTTASPHSSRTTSVPAAAPVPITRALNALVR
jgi:hypothetical protein